MNYLKNPVFKPVLKRGIVPIFTEYNFFMHVTFLSSTQVYEHLTPKKLSSSFLNLWHSPLHNYLPFPTEHVGGGRLCGRLCLTSFAEISIYGSFAKLYAYVYYNSVYLIVHIIILIFE